MHFMGQNDNTNVKVGSQFQPFSEESDLLNTEEQAKTEKTGMKMPSFKNIAEILKNMEYPFNQLSCFY